MQDKDQELQHAEGGKEQPSENINTGTGENSKHGPIPSTDQPLDPGEATSSKSQKDAGGEKTDPDIIQASTQSEESPLGEEGSQPVATAGETGAGPEEKGDMAPPGETAKEPVRAEAGDPMEEIDESNAEDAEDRENEKRHYIPLLDYHAMPMENLVGELQRLVRNEKVQAIGKHVSAIKYEFDQKYQEFLEHKKEEFLAKGGNEIDFKYNSVDKRQFNEVYADYREKRDHYHRQLEQTLKNNLQTRLELIEQLKGLISVEEDINTTYTNFKNIQERWKNAGAIPRNNYNDVWRTYHHHMEIFYDFLHLNRELRDLDFKYNLEEKQKLVERAEALASEPDLGKAFRELQTLHKIWKEDIGPVGKEHREEIWERFSNATKVIHQRRQVQLGEMEAVLEKNLEKKREIIGAIQKIAENVGSNHKQLQQQIRELEGLRDAFFKTGRVPQKVNEQTWNEFKTAVRQFNHHKNAFYKDQKREQHHNLDLKRALVEKAQSLKDSEDWDRATPEMKRIQSEWKAIGHVPRKYSDKIWKEFKTACNHYFDRLHAQMSDAQKGELENFDKKMATLQRLKAYQLSGDKAKDLADIKAFLQEWKEHGRIPHNKKHLNGKFNKIVDALLKKVGVSRQESELLKYGNKMQRLAQSEDDRALGNERAFIRKKIDEGKAEIRQLENNLQFFSNASEDNPLVQEVIKNIERQKEGLQTWKEKLKKLNILENNINRQAEQNGPNSDEEE